MINILFITLVGVVGALSASLAARAYLSKEGFTFSDSIFHLHALMYVVALNFILVNYHGMYDALTTIIILSFILSVSLVDTNSTLMPKEFTWTFIVVVCMVGFFNPVHKPIEDIFSGVLLTLLLWFFLFFIINYKNSGSLGKGDVFFMAGIGGWLGFVNSLYAALIALCLFTGSMMTVRIKYMRLEGAPLGPFLSIGAVMIYIWS